MKLQWVEIFLSPDFASIITVQFLSLIFCATWIRNILRLRIVIRTHQPEAADAHLHSALIDRAKSREIRLDQRRRILDRLAIRGRNTECDRTHFRAGTLPPTVMPPKSMASAKTFGLFASIM